MGIDWTFRLSDILLFGTAGITVLVGYVRMQSAVTDAKDTATAAEEAAAKAVQDAKEMTAAVSMKVDLISTNLNNFKIEAAEKYTARRDLVAVEERLLSAVERLTDRVDELLQRR